MPSLNQLAEQVAIKYNKQFDTPFNDFIKDLIKQARATLLRQSANKYGVDRGWTNRYVIELEAVDVADNCNVTVGCTTLRSINKIPTPVRFTTDIPFIYVGSVDGNIVFGHMPFYAVKNKKDRKYGSDKITYDWVNNYLYVYVVGIPKLKWVAIEALHESPDLVPYCDDGGGICYTDDMEFPCPLDIVQTIKLSLMQGELSKLLSPDSEVKQNEEPTDIRR